MCIKIIGQYRIVITFSPSKMPKMKDLILYKSSIPPGKRINEKIKRNRYNNISIYTL